MGFIDDLIGAVVPKSIYDPSTGRILGGIFGGGGGAVPDPTSPAPDLGGVPDVMGATTWAPSVAPGESFRDPTAAAQPSWWQNILAGLAAPTIPGTQGVVGGPVSGALVPLGGGGLVQVGGGALARRVLPPLVRVVAAAVIAYGGEKLATSIYNAYVQFRRQGHSHKRSRRLAHQVHGIGFRRRRMRPTNVQALRRAIRRVHGFKRIARKVGALGVSSRGRFTHPRRHMRRARRGDVGPFMVEDYADMLDEAEDFDLDGEQFSDSAVGE